VDKVIELLNYLRQLPGASNISQSTIETILFKGLGGGVSHLIYNPENNREIELLLLSQLFYTGFSLKDWNK
jgi:hypothetical protein